MRLNSSRVVFLLCFCLVTVVGVGSSVLANDGMENALLQHGGGGAFSELIQLDVAGLNSVLQEGGFGAMNDWMVTYGGGLFSQTEYNFRYSNFFAKGKLEAVGVQGKSARLSLTHGGVWLEQVFPLVPELGVSAGGALSLGGMKLELVHNQMDSFSEGVSQPQETVASVPFFMIKPEVGVHYSIKRYLDFELKLGYYYSHILGRWKQGGQRVQGEQPLAQSHGASVMVHFNLGF